MTMRSSMPTLALLVAATACTPSPPPPQPTVAATPPVVSLGSATAATPVSAAPTTSVPAKPPPYTPCVAAIYDQVRPFDGDRAAAVLDGKPVTIDREGRVVHESAP